MATPTQPILTDEVLQNRYQIIETDEGLQISESRVLLFDVMEAHDAGNSIYEISDTFNLTPLQVETAIRYIERHRSTLTPKFAKAIQRRKEREEYYRKLAAERWEKIGKLPVTPLHEAVHALLDQYR